jgi:hypothetical protein
LVTVFDSRLRGDTDAASAHTASITRSALALQCNAM